MELWHKETTPGTTGSRCTIQDENGFFVAECIASDSAKIVEAPAMLEALRLAMTYGETDGALYGTQLPILRAKIRAILARIDGEAPTAEPEPAAETCQHCGAERGAGPEQGLWTCSACNGLNSPAAEPAAPTGDADGEAVRTVEDAAAMIRDGVGLLETVDFVDDSAIEEGRLVIVPAEGPAFRVAVTLYPR